MDGNAPSLGDLALEDLSMQLATVARQLAVVRSQYQQLLSFVRANADALGLTEVIPDDTSAATEAPEPLKRGAEVVVETPAVVNGKSLPKEPAKT